MRVGKRNFRWGLLFLLGSVILFFSSCKATQKIAHLDSRGENIICFGDSITAGQGASAGRDYPLVLSQMLQLPVINAGHSGDSTLEALQRLERDVLYKDPLLVVIILGGNDYLRRMSLEMTYRNLDEIVAKIEKEGAMVVLGEMCAGTLMEDYVVIYRKIAQRHGSVVISRLMEGILDRSELKSDFIHPNEAGYQLVAQRVYSAILPLLEANRKARAARRTN